MPTSAAPALTQEDILIHVKSPIGNMTETPSDEGAEDECDTLYGQYTATRACIDMLTFAEYQRLFLRGCSLRVHHPETKIILWFQ